MQPPRKINWLVWGGAALGCVVFLALGLVYLTMYLTARIAAKVEAKHLLHPEPTTPPLEADIAVVATDGKTLPDGKYHYTVKLSNAGKSALLVQHVSVRLLDSAGEVVTTDDLRNSIVVPGAPQEFAGEVALPAADAARVQRVDARIVPTPTS